MTDKNNYTLNMLEPSPAAKDWLDKNTPLDPYDPRICVDISSSCYSFKIMVDIVRDLRKHPAYIAHEFTIHDGIFWLQVYFKTDHELNEEVTND